MEQSQEKQIEKIEVAPTDTQKLVVFNDEVNTFQHVTETLIRVCKHNPEQAEQCTWIIHHKGKCVVKEGPAKNLQPMCRLIHHAGLHAQVI